jgi:hypothetical protein
VVKEVTERLTDLEDDTAKAGPCHQKNVQRNFVCINSIETASENDGAEVWEGTIGVEESLKGGEVWFFPLRQL